MLPCETSQRHGPVADTIRPGPGVAKKNPRWCYDSPSGGSPAATETNRPAETGPDNSGSVTRGFEEDPDEMWRLQVAYGDPSLDQLRRARDYTQELRKEGKVRPPRRRRRVILDE
jgi:hypothetical protein